MPSCRRGRPSRDCKHRRMLRCKPSFGWATAEGTAVFGLDGKGMRSFLLVFSGAFRMAPPYDGSDRPTGGVAEWRAEGKEHF